MHLVVVGDGDLRQRARAACRDARSFRPRALPRRAARPRQPAECRRCVRAPVALGRAAAVARPGDGRGAACRGDRGRRHSRGRRERPDRPAGSGGRCRGARARARPRRRRIRRSAGNWRDAARAVVRPRFGVDGYVSSMVALYDRLLEREGRVTLGIVYHMPFWRDADGTLREVEGSFARYVDSLAPYFDEVSLCVPVLRRSRPATGPPIRSSNVTLAPLPPFDGPRAVLPAAAGVLPRLLRVGARIDRPALPRADARRRSSRSPPPVCSAGRRFCSWSATCARCCRSMPYRGVKRLLWRAYTAFEELNVQWMANHVADVCQRPRPAAKHTRPGRPAIETTTTTISDRRHRAARRHLRRPAGCAR